MPNRFEQVDELVPDAITLVLEQRTDGQWAKVHVPKSAMPDKLPQNMLTSDMPPFDALCGAIKFANDLKLALVVMDRDAIWNAEWGELYRWEDEPEAMEAEAGDEAGETDGGKPS
jgi:hypothetical protein